MTSSKSAYFYRFADMFIVSACLKPKRALPFHGDPEVLSKDATPADIGVSIARALAMDPAPEVSEADERAGAIRIMEIAKVKTWSAVWKKTRYATIDLQETGKVELRPMVKMKGGYGSDDARTISLSDTNDLQGIGEAALSLTA